MRRDVNRRKYIRISTVLPVEFFLLDKTGNRLTPWLQGFSRDIAKGGICLTINDLWWGFWDRFNQDGAEVVLRINVPFRKEPLAFKAKIAWFRQERLQEFNCYKIGLEFIEVYDKKRQTLFSYAFFKKALPFVLSGTIILLVIFSFSMFWRARFFIQENRKLVSDYVSILDKKSSLEKSLVDEIKFKYFFTKRKEELTRKISSLEGRINQLKDGFSSESSVAKISFLEVELKGLERESKFLSDKNREIKSVTEGIRGKVESLQRERLKFSPQIIAGMYNWIKNRQDLIKGLVLSYEGDPTLERVCFSYDQALASMVFLISGDKQRARKILDFYSDQMNKKGNIYNAYFVQGDVFEYVIHSGPNAWIGLASLCYVKETGNKKYLILAEKIGSFLIKMMDDEGGVAGGPDIDWYSTEHNLDAYAFFNLLHELGGKRRYLDAAKKIERWITRYSYTQYGPPVKRGKGDSTIATDTYTWSINSFGPEVLYRLKMNPEAILEFAISHCEVEVDFKRKEGEVTIKGFDFVKSRNSARGGVVSGEWTSQMILALEIMADYFQDKNPSKSKMYLSKASFYFDELQKMLITSLSRVGREDPCLPYASSSFVDTGHGWRTPKGNKTGSLASTAYFLFAYYGYNPLKGEFLNLSLEDAYREPLDVSRVLDSSRLDN